MPAGLEGDSAPFCIDNESPRIAGGRAGAMKDTNERGLS